MYPNRGREGGKEREEGRRREGGRGGWAPDGEREKAENQLPILSKPRELAKTSCSISTRHSSTIPKHINMPSLQEVPDRPWVGICMSITAMPLPDTEGSGQGEEPPGIL